MAPSDYAQFLSAAFLGPIVMMLTAPFRGKIADAYLPLVAFALSVAMGEAVALHLGTDPLMAAFAGMATALEATALYHLGKNASESTDPAKTPPVILFHGLDGLDGFGDGEADEPVAPPPAPPGEAATIVESIKRDDHQAEVSPLGTVVTGAPARVDPRHPTFGRVDSVVTM